MDTSTSPSRRLRTLFLGGYDSTNYAYVELIRELTARGHECILLVDDLADAINNKMFTAASIRMRPFAAFDLKELGRIDMVFAGPFLPRHQRRFFLEIERRGITLISFANLFSSVTMRISPDVVLAPSEAKFEEFAQSGAAYTMVAAGNPQYDPLVRARETRRSPAGDIKRVIVVEQGAYPFGEAGKRQLADTLMHLARSNPGIEFVIKPRYLPDEKGKRLHRPTEHLYDYLEGRPPNLVTLEVPTILEETIVDYDAMITTWSTAFRDAVALDMPLLIIAGLDSIDVFDVREARVDQAYAYLAETGCVADWRDLFTQPLQFNRVPATFAAREFYDASKPCAPRLVDLFEHIGRVNSPAESLGGPPIQLPLHEFIDRLVHETAAVRPAVSPAALRGRKARRQINEVVQQLVFDNRCMGYELDTRSMRMFLEHDIETFARDGDRLLAQARSEVYRIKAEFFAANHDRMTADPFLQDYYFDWLGTVDRGRALLAYDGPVVAPESLAYRRGLSQLRRRRVLSAAHHLAHAFSLSLLKADLQLHGDKIAHTLATQSDRSLASCVTVAALYRYGKLAALSGLEIRHPGKSPVAVFYRARALERMTRFEEAQEACQEYSAAARPSRRGGIQGRVLDLVGAVYDYRIRRLQSRLTRR